MDPMAGGPDDIQLLLHLSNRDTLLLQQYQYTKERTIF